MDLGKDIVIDEELEEGETVEDGVEHELPSPVIEQEWVNDDAVDVGGDIQKEVNLETNDADWEETPSYKAEFVHWFIKQTMHVALPTMKKTYSIRGISESKKGIMCWLFDDGLKMFVLKRYDGVQYFKKFLRSFNSLHDCEVKDLRRLRLINQSNDGIADVIAKIIWREAVRDKKWELVKPQLGKFVEDEERGVRENGRPWMIKKYKPVKCVKKIPLKTMSQNVGGLMKWWYVDSNIAEAVMEDEDEQELLRIYHPMHLVNLSKSDLQILFEKKIFYKPTRKSER